MSTAIYQALEAQGKTVIEIAHDIGVSRGAVYQSINGYGSRSIRVKLALMAKKKPSELWGRCYQYELDDLFFEKKVGEQ